MLSTASKRNEVLAAVWRASTVGGEKCRLVAPNKVEAAYARPDRFERPAGAVER